jgi:hypothetical protein
MKNMKIKKGQSKIKKLIDAKRTKGHEAKHLTVSSAPFHWSPTNSSLHGLHALHGQQFLVLFGLSSYPSSASW